jgi:hypothetical protein
MGDNFFMNFSLYIEVTVDYRYYKKLTLRVSWSVMQHLDWKLTGMTLTVGMLLIVTSQCRNEVAFLY